LTGAERAELVRLIRRIRDTGTTVLLVEHDVGLVMEVADRVLVLNYGRRIAEGTPRVVRNDPRVIAAYLGEEAVSITSPTSCSTRRTVVPVSRIRRMSLT